MRTDGTSNAGVNDRGHLPSVQRSFHLRSRAVRALKSQLHANVRWRHQVRHCRRIARDRRPFPRRLVVRSENWSRLMCFNVSLVSRSLARHRPKYRADQRRFSASVRSFEKQALPIKIEAERVPAPSCSGHRILPFQWFSTAMSRYLLHRPVRLRLSRPDLRLPRTLLTGQ